MVNKNGTKDRFIKIRESLGQEASGDSIAMGNHMGNMRQLVAEEHGQRMEAPVTVCLWSKDGQKLERVQLN